MEQKEGRRQQWSGAGSGVTGGESGTSGVYEEGGQQRSRARGEVGGAKGSGMERGEEAGGDSGTSGTYEERCLPANNGVDY